MKNHFIQADREAVRAATARRCAHCQKRVKLYRESPYLNPVWRCVGCGRTEEVETEPVKVMEFK